MSQRIVVLAASGVSLFLVYVAAGAAFCSATLHVRRESGPSPAGAVTVAIAARDKTELKAWLLQPARSNGNCVIVLHGIADSKIGSAGFAPMFLNEGYSVLLPDSRGHGESGGEFVTYGLLEKYDVADWARWMKDRGCGDLYGLGESLGASILIQATAMGPLFRAAVAECPFADLQEAAEFRMRKILPAPLAGVMVNSGAHYARWVKGLDFRQVSPLQSIVRSQTPILLIHGLADTETPPADSIRLAKANPRNSLWLVPGAEHTGADTVAPEEFRERVLGWFSGSVE